MFVVVYWDNLNLVNIPNVGNIQYLCTHYVKWLVATSFVDTELEKLIFQVALTTTDTTAC